MRRSFEENNHAFIIRVWIEPREISGMRPEWRGMIEHVASGERHYVHHLDDFLVFIASYLIRLGVKLSIWWWVGLRLRRWLTGRSDLLKIE